MKNDTQSIKNVVERIMSKKPKPKEKKKNYSITATHGVCG